MLGMTPRVLPSLSKDCATGLHPSPSEEICWLKLHLPAALSVSQAAHTQSTKKTFESYPRECFWAKWESEKPSSPYHRNAQRNACGEHWDMLQLPLLYTHLTALRCFCGLLQCVTLGQEEDQVTEQRPLRLQGQWSKSMRFDKWMLRERPIDLGFRRLGFWRLPWKRRYAWLNALMPWQHYLL